MPNNMERFTQRARRVLSLAQEEAERFEHSYIGPEHLLIGLIREEGGVAGRVLRNVGLDQRRVEELVERMTRAGKRTWNARLELSPGTKDVLELAVDECRRLGHEYIGTEHLLLGIVQQSESVAIEVFKRLNIKPSEIRSEILEVLQKPSLQVDQLVPAPLSKEPAAETKPETQAASGQEFTVSLARFVPVILGIAVSEAAKLRYDYVGTEHLLLALLLDQKNVAGHVLRILGITSEHIREVVQSASTGEPESPVQPRFSPELINVLGMAVEEAFLTGNLYLRSEHLLLGLVRQKESKAIDILKKFDVSPTLIEKTVRGTMGSAAP